MERLLELYKLNAKAAKYKSSTRLGNFKSIEFKKVSINFGLNEPLFERLNFKINTGSLAVIHGENGSGKSTVLYLLMKVFNITEGEILIGNVNLEKINREA
ncbi:MAG: ATP-binding cassette domain-containing protein [Pedobacter sp.]|nr:MAG: ATP-binding cassette domain-containing protein [Pedobacter sp.]